MLIRIEGMVVVLIIKQDKHQFMKSYFTPLTFSKSPSDPKFSQAKD